ncbi:RNA polymerase sigma factor [Neobacillus rhizophilus]|uniref:RNA polymerase sigma factor n=1 Tax=Neobacillus rhizophilus TaxID=2833579 RepID=A0A942YYM2_9BACI|nr:RNA polymerase sigma factor [Neobacillus rhizophilus]MBS4216285.1 RNA polymerase sigma factor [Neobacillus rhizophilus]MBU8917154.1 RNA polymerase sigma factor [Bacillus sp. FJAT-29953]
MNAVNFNEVYSKHAKRLYYIAYQYTRDEFLAEDIVQESFLKAYRKLDTVEDNGKLGAWLSAITARTAIDFLRSEKRRHWTPMDYAELEPLHCVGSSSGSSTEEAAVIRLFQEEIGGSIENLSKEFREVLILKMQYGLKETEIASRLNLKSATVKTRLYRARKQLRRILAAG